MKYLPNIVAVLLGLLFIAASAAYFFGPPPPAMPAGTAPDFFMKAVGPTGFMSYVKFFEILGGILVAIPKTRNFGLLILGPIILNIVAFHAFVTGGSGLFSPMLIGICVAALYLLWVGRKRFAGLLN